VRPIPTRLTTVRARRGLPALLLVVLLPALAGLTGCDPTPTVSAYLHRTSVPNSGVTYVGTVAPVVSGERAVVQRLFGSTWTDVASAAVAPDGSYAVPVAPTGAATYAQRVVSRTTAGQQAASGTSYQGVPAPAALPASIGQWLATRSSSTSVAVYDARTGLSSYYGTNQRYVCASIAKVSILGTVLSSAARANRPLSAAEAAHAVPMIQQSSNDDATWLWDEVGQGPAVQAYQRSLGMNATVQDPLNRWGLATTTAADQVRAVQGLLWPNPVLRAGDQAYARALMHGVTASQHWGVSAGVPAGATVELKNGWLPYGGAWRVNSIGHVSDATHDYVIAVLTSTPGTGDSSFYYGINTIEGVSRLLWGGSPTGSSSAMTPSMRVAPDTSDAGR
jgi:beta-lactamase class A